MRRRVAILGSTGSIGTQALDVIAHVNSLHERGESPLCFEVVALAAGNNVGVLRDQAARFPRARLALAGAASDAPPEAMRGADAAERLIREVECDVVLAAMVGVAGLPATLAAIELGRDVALANKETLVAAGAIVVPAAQKSGSRLLPVDSEHAAVWQCLRGGGDGEAPPIACDRRVSRVVLTASGGPFRTWSRERMWNATPADALKHPTWRMGPKVTIDSASLTNKALELIEAHWLFGLGPERLGAVVHPQSIVHSLVEFVDGSVVAQLGPADMRGPIQHALCWPERVGASAPRLDLLAAGKLEFERPDVERFPALAIADEVMRSGGTAGAIFNAANEACVEAFLASGSMMTFGRIAELTKAATREIEAGPVRSVEDVMRADARARAFVMNRLGGA